MHDSEKCYRKRDRLSDLPDEVLHHILSFLPTYEAIATCLVSTRWRFLWTMVPSLHFHCTKPISYERDINRFLRLRTTKAITRFHLNGKHYPYPYYLCTNLRKWVDAAKRGNVEHLSISLCKSYKRDPLIMGIPSLFMCTTLVTLNLNLGGSVSLTVPSSVHLPSLKTLHLDQCIKCFHDAKRVLYGCPSLELFHLSQSHKSIDFMELKIERSSRVIRLWERKGYHTCVDIVIESDRDHDFVRDYIEGHLEKLVKVKAYITVRQTKSVNIFIYRYISFRTLKGLSNVEFLSLRDFLPWTSYIGNYNNEEFNRDDLPQFQNLVKLRLYIEDAKSIHRTLPAKCPKLQVANPDHGFSFNKICQYHATR